MKSQKLSISGAVTLSHEVFPDERGFFREWFRSGLISSVTDGFNVKQANLSQSKRGVIRGIHYSLVPEGQAKLVTCAFGSVTDILVDLRLGSPSYLKIEYIDLKYDSGKVVFIPSGVGHGFLATSEIASVMYLTSSEYAPEFEKAICPTDIDLDIKWPLDFGEIGVISRTDTEAPSLKQMFEAGLLPHFKSV